MDTRLAPWLLAERWVGRVQRAAGSQGLDLCTDILAGATGAGGAKELNGGQSLGMALPGEEEEGEEQPGKEVKC